jgi:hypothetical protein
MTGHNTGIKSLDEYIDDVDRAIKADQKNYLFIEECYGIVRNEEKDVVDCTMYNILIQFKERMLGEPDIDYIAFLQERKESLTYNVMKSIYDSIDTASELHAIAASGTFDIQLNISDIAMTASRAARDMESTHIMANALKGYIMLEQHFKPPKIPYCNVN